MLQEISICWNMPLSNRGIVKTCATESQQFVSEHSHSRIIGRKESPLALEMRVILLDREAVCLRINLRMRLSWHSIRNEVWRIALGTRVIQGTSTRSPSIQPRTEVDSATTQC